ncbi:P27 family phage terminase small subunit [Clostridium estertheticum]|uniref:P27 family phage terminase small subunit n=1 Tax=Clostridium estertheticum TaxID=238834 RepID=A0AA47EJF1_9CLOT|nr:P27 family phage terminase small subunit [Clostridium estertheticum]MBU3153907.1 P27 family phage terminase small subunit [Clostridium estertheticum]WAG61319.1 P27 family phage terminase small subunit [Clostridium estertheticum]
MANIKPIELQTKHSNPEDIQKRMETEEALKGNTVIEIKPPTSLSTTGKKFYKKIIEILPSGFLNGGDTYCVTIIAESLDKMQLCQKEINKNGLFIDGNENKGVGTYKKYVDIFNTFSQKIGLSPRDRASLSILNINSETDKNDKVLQALKGGDNK